MGKTFKKNDYRSQKYSKFVPKKKDKKKHGKPIYNQPDDVEFTKFEDS